ncbi:hypothetical protein OG875_19875 [Streptomyces sp. NBC_01498]|uniref:hypothetical protein n=1 Tax=Streptomyces sp. NBC_01498 TaxID=2975870 RepID=UPI002E7B1288|nr:hypothetical protein [Streptomyces sp. NBC_01498]WTL26625.1 hypothetical protein OG875_19875 [Streptomyces sp. NBC_01498]
MTMRRRLVGAVAAGAALAGMATAVAPAAGAAESSAAVWRNIVIDGTYTIRDDEGWSAGTYCNGSLSAQRWANEVPAASLWWSTTCGGEIRTEMHAAARTNPDGSALIEVTLLLFEGTNDTNNDLDAEYSFVSSVPADQVTQLSQISLLSQENGGKDYAKLNLTLHNQG